MRRSMACALAMVRASEHLTPAQQKSLNRMSAQMSLVNAINYRSQGDRAESVKLLREAFRADPTIIFDPRFAYTSLRLIKIRP
jgi:hypothetical protein